MCVCCMVCVFVHGCPTGRETGVPPGGDRESEPNEGVDEEGKRHNRRWESLLVVVDSYFALLRLFPPPFFALSVCLYIIDS